MKEKIFFFLFVQSFPFSLFLLESHPPFKGCFNHSLDTNILEVLYLIKHPSEHPTSAFYEGWLKFNMKSHGG